MTEAPAGGPREFLPLKGLRMLELGDELGAYAGRLLADLGAEVLRIEPPGGDAVRRRDPLVPTPEGPVSAYAWFVNLNKGSITLDLGNADDRETLLALAEDADVFIDTLEPGELRRLGLAPERLAERNPRLIHTSITPFGQTGPYASFQSTDLITLAAGGLLSLGGYPDAEPVAPYGGQSRLAASIFGAVAVLLALIARRHDGIGRWIDVSAQECVAHALEDTIPEYDLTGRVRRRVGDLPREAGTGVFPCQDGFVSMVAGRLGTAKAWRALTEWLAEEGAEGAAELLEPDWQEFPFRRRPASAARFYEIFTGFTSTRRKADLYAEGQRRSIALCPVNEVADVLEDPQLAFRGFFGPVHLRELDRTVDFPGRPYRTGATTPLARRPPARLGEDDARILEGVRGGGADERPGLAEGKVI